MRPRALSSLLIPFALTLAFFSPLTVHAAKKAAQKGSTIYVIRGGGGYFPNLGTVINQKFEAKGLNVVDFRYHERFAAAQQMAQAYRNKKLPSGIIMIGYSLGGVGVLEVANLLKDEGIPVRLLFLIETINPVQTVPSNVQECFNLYHFPAVLGSAVKADSPNTKLTNFEAYSDGKLGLNYSHFTMPFVPEVHELIASHLIAAIQTKAPRVNAVSGTAREQKIADTGKRKAPASTDAFVEKKNPFAEFFGRTTEVPASNKVDAATEARSKKAATTTKASASVKGKTTPAPAAEPEKKNPFAELFGVKSSETSSTDQAKTGKATDAKKATAPAKTTASAKGKTTPAPQEEPKKKNPFAELFGVKSSETSSTDQAKTAKATDAKKATAPAKTTTVSAKRKTTTAPQEEPKKKNPFAELFATKAKSSDAQSSAASATSKKD